MALADPDLEALYRRAIADPKSITRAERNAIWGWPPPEEEDRLCIARTGHTRAELIAKALSSPDDLTPLEAKIVYEREGAQVKLDLSWEEKQERRTLLYRVSRDKSPLQVLCNEAWSAVIDPQEWTAHGNAYKSERAAENTRLDEMYRQEQELLRTRRLEQGTPWMKDMLRDGLLEGAECWGFVVFRTGCYDEEGESLWQTFRQHLEKVAQTSILHWNGGPELWPTFGPVFIEDAALEGASDEQLRSRFRAMRDEEHWPKGMRTNCFLVADKAIIESETAQAPYVPRYRDIIQAEVNIRDDDPVVWIHAVDPDYPLKGAKAKEEAWGLVEAMGDFEGVATVALPAVFTWLHYVCFQAERGTATNINLDHKPMIGWCDIHFQTRRPEAWIRNLASFSGGITYISHTLRR